MIAEIRFRGKLIKFDLQRHSDYSAFYQVLVENSYSHLLDGIRPGDIVLDAGANIGIFTVLASILVGDRGKVVSIEPDPENLKILKRNITINGLMNVKVVERALYNCSDMEIELTINGVMSKIKTSETSSHFRYVRVKTIAFDDLVNQLEITPSILKMDIEGAERYALQNADKTLEGLREIEAEIHDSICEQAIMQFPGFDFSITSIENFRAISRFFLKHPIKTVRLEWYNHFETFKRILHDGIKLSSSYPLMIYGKHKV